VSAHKCKYFNRCSAPLCPLDENSLQNGVWYPDEEICRLREFQGLRWVQNQRELKKRGVPVDGYFTAAMLDNEIIFHPDIRGIDPDRKDEEKQIKRWLERYVRRVVLEPVFA